jgi:hypothetical protein
MDEDREDPRQLIATRLPGEPKNLTDFPLKKESRL